MKQHHVAICAVLMAGLGIGGFSRAGYAQNAARPSIRFISPSSLRCSANVSWARQLAKWSGRGGACGEGTLYTITGEVPGVAEGYVEATIVVPEDNDKEWDAYNGKKHEIINHRFEVSYCITTTEADRPIRIQAYANSGQQHGELCEVILTR